MLSTVRLLAVTFAFMLGGLVAADDAAAEPAGSTGEMDDPGHVLAGPEVEESEAAAENRMRPQSDRAGRRTPWPRWYGAALHLDLGPQQRKDIEAVAKELKVARRAFLDKHRPELAGLRRALRDMRQSGATPPRELREQLATINEEAPKVEEYQQRIWELLDFAQRERLRAKLNALEEAAAASERTRGPRRGGSDREADPGAEQMAPGPPGMENGAAAPAQRRRVDHGTMKLDEPARRRLEFLRQRQLSHEARISPTPEVAAATRFTFDEDDAPEDDSPEEKR